MKFYYLTDESEKSLAPFFSPIMITTTFRSILIVGGLLIVFWPWQSLVNFMNKHQGPLVFSAMFTATLIIHSYIHLRCGRGELVKRPYYGEFHKEVVAFEKEHDFLQYGLIEFLLHTLFLMLPLLPLFLLSTSLSGLSLTMFVKGCSVVFTASLLCRMFGFLMYLFRGRASTIGYLFSRIFLFGFIFATIIFAPEINPIFIIYEMNRSLQSISRDLQLQSISLPVTGSYTLYMAIVLFAIGVLVIVNQILVRYHINKKKKSVDE